MNTAVQRSGSCVNMHAETLDLPELLVNLVYPLYSQIPGSNLNAFVGRARLSA